ncbi:hypothetical protein [Krasilnikoviella flava]|uniref:hypothetical protein n=1 Tax=Krasilnikoviella flava TaxID=526729 RepID=UPI001FE739D8|nr:hypothetical protein [Krasilnikoviella flava]
MPDDAVPDSYTTRFVIVRQDQHVTWRGDLLPGDPSALAAHPGAAGTSGVSGVGVAA